MVAVDEDAAVAARAKLDAAYTAALEQLEDLRGRLPHPLDYLDHRLGALEGSAGFAAVCKVTAEDVAYAHLMWREAALEDELRRRFAWVKGDGLQVGQHCPWHASVSMATHCIQVVHQFLLEWELASCGSPHIIYHKPLL